MTPTALRTGCVVKVACNTALIQIQIRFALITFYSAPEDFIAAFRTDIAGLFILNPFLGADLSPIRNGPQNNLLADRHGEIINMPTREFIALMTSDEAFFLAAFPDVATLAMQKEFIRQAPAAADIFC
jgi:hypothetical protein